MATTMEPLASITTGSGATEVTFSSISTAFRDLRIVIRGGLTGATYWRVMFNGVTGNYTLAYGAGNGSSVSGSWTNGQSRGYLHYDSWVWDGANSIQVDIMDAFTTDKHKGYISRLSKPYSPSGGNGHVEMLFGTWQSTDAISSIVVAPQGYAIATGTTISLYGVKA